MADHRVAMTPKQRNLVHGALLWATEVWLGAEATDEDILRATGLSRSDLYALQEWLDALQPIPADGDPATETDPIYVFDMSVNEALAHQSVRRAIVACIAIASEGMSVADLAVIHEATHTELAQVGELFGGGDDPVPRGADAIGQWCYKAGLLFREDPRQWVLIDARVDMAVDRVLLVAHDRQGGRWTVGAHPVDGPDEVELDGASSLSLIRILERDHRRRFMRPSRRSPQATAGDAWADYSIAARDFPRAQARELIASQLDITGAWDAIEGSGIPVVADVLIGRGTLRAGELAGWTVDAYSAGADSFTYEFTHYSDGVLDGYFDSWAENIKDFAAYAVPSSHDIEWDWLTPRLRQEIDANLGEGELWGDGWERWPRMAADALARHVREVSPALSVASSFDIDAGVASLTVTGPASEDTSRTVSLECRWDCIWFALHEVSQMWEWDCSELEEVARAIATRVADWIADGGVVHYRERLLWRSVREEPAGNSQAPGASSIKFGFCGWRNYSIRY